MFVTDTVDAMYPPDSWSPQAIIDRLGDILAHGSRSPMLSAGTQDKGVLEEEKIDGHVSRRVPFLRKRRIDKLSDLEPFFARISLANYEAVYNAGTRLDMAEVEHQIVLDIFEGPSST